MPLQKINLQNNNNPLVDDELLLEHNLNSSDRAYQVSTSNLGNESMNKPSKVFIILTILAVLAGVGTGFGTFRLSAKSGLIGNKAQLATTPTEGKVKAGDVFGSTDAVFDSNAQGYLEEGGLEGEGSHRLLRPGGESQTVYLTSSVTDLDEFVGMEVKLWGETFKSQKAGWFMDVGRVEVVVVNGESPAQEPEE